MTLQNNHVSLAAIAHTLCQFAHLETLSIGDATIHYVNHWEGYAMCDANTIRHIDPGAEAKHILAISRRQAHINDIRVLFVDGGGRLFAATQQYSGPDLPNGGNQFEIQYNTVSQRELEGIIPRIRQTVQDLLSPAVIAANLEKFANMEPLKEKWNPLSIFYISDRRKGLSMCDGSMIHQMDPNGEAAHLIGTYYEAERRNSFGVFFVTKGGKLLAATHQESGPHWGNTIETLTAARAQSWFEDVILKISRYAQGSAAHAPIAGTA